MYHPLVSDRGSFTEYVSSDLPKLTSGTSNPTAQCGASNVYGPMQFASVTHLAGTRTTYEPPSLVQADHIQIESIPDESIPSLVRENMKNETDSTG